MTSSLTCWRRSTASEVSRAGAAGEGASETVEREMAAAGVPCCSQEENCGDGGSVACNGRRPLTIVVHPRLFA